MADHDLKIVELIQAIDTTLQKVHTQALDLSFNELLDMYSSNELDISPDYQRLFQWTEGAQSRFIESLLLEMPVPPIYVVEEDEGRYMLIDGLQRISSYLHLRGKLSAPHLNPPIAPGNVLTLVDCDIVDELNGHTYDDLGTALQIRLKRAFVRVEVVRKGSDARFKYHMFKRLNTGGQLLTAQQVRNCTIRLLSPGFNNFIIQLSHDEAFRECIAGLTEERILGAFDQELVLRFFALKNDRHQFKHDIEDFLTEYMEAVSDPISPIKFDYVSEREVFEKTFAVLRNALQDSAFAFANKEKSKLTKSFSVLHFEAISLGILLFLDRLDPSDHSQMARLGDALTTLKLDDTFVRLTTGGGKNSSGQLRARISAVEQALAEFGR